MLVLSKVVSLNDTIVSLACQVLIGYGSVTVGDLLLLVTSLA